MGISSSFRHHLDSQREYHAAIMRNLSDGNLVAFAEDKVFSLLAKHGVPVNFDRIQVRPSASRDNFHVTIDAPVPYEWLVDNISFINLRLDWTDVWVAESGIHADYKYSGTEVKIACTLQAPADMDDIETLKRIGKIRPTPIETRGGEFVLQCFD